jgi:hypothetical protein
MCAFYPIASFTGFSVFSGFFVSTFVTVAGLSALCSPIFATNLQVCARMFGYAVVMVHRVAAACADWLKCGHWIFSGFSLSSGISSGV